MGILDIFASSKSNNDSDNSNIQVIIYKTDGDFVGTKQEHKKSVKTGDTILIQQYKNLSNVTATISRAMEVAEINGEPMQTVFIDNESIMRSLSENIETFNDFKKYLSMLDLDTLIDIFNVYNEDYDENVICPIFTDEYGSYDWISRFAEENGKPNDSNCERIITNILLNAYKNEYVFIKNSNSDLTFIRNKEELKDFILEHDDIKSLYNTPDEWKQEGSSVYDYMFG